MTANDGKLIIVNRTKTKWITRETVERRFTFN